MTDGGRILVLTTVHQADDPRIRRRTVGVLAREHAVRYATKPPAPRGPDDHEWVPLHGGRLRRALVGLRTALRPDVAVLVIEDPELLWVAVVVRVLRRIPVVFDVHEDVPAQLRTKEWLPAALRPPLAALATGALRLAERALVITLAEAGYARRFARGHPVFPNYPLVEDLPPPRASDGSVVYVGDITRARGALLAVEAVARIQPPPPLVLIGRCLEPLATQLRAHAEELGVDLELTGFLPHPEAMARVASAAVGLCPLLDIPNYRHSLPTKTLEYLALGVPVVASELPGTAELIAGAPGAVLVPPGDVAAWAEAIARVRDDARLRSATVAAAPSVRATRTWPAERFLAFYRDVRWPSPASR